VTGPPVPLATTTRTGPPATGAGLGWVRTIVGVVLLGLLAGCDLVPGEPPALYAAVSQADDTRVKRLLVGSLAVVRALLQAGADPCATVEWAEKRVLPSGSAAASKALSRERRAVVDALTEAERRC